MKGIIFYLVYSFLWLITLLPLSILYRFSDLLYGLLYYVVKYRKKTVYFNLSRSFPEKSPEEIRRIAKLFYHQLTDYFLEWMYRIHMGERELSRRMHYVNPEILGDYYAQGKSIMLLQSHYGNWEWTTRISCLSDLTTLAIYKTLQNKYFDRLFLNLRSRFGIVGVPMESTLRRTLEYRNAGMPVMVYTVADQRPRWKHSDHWTLFLNQDTPVITGPEKIARKFGMPVLLLAIDKVKRGYYRAEFHVVCEAPGQVPEFEIIRRYMASLEQRIKSRPELWLWTHKRWKYHRNEIKNPVDIGPIN